MWLPKLKDKPALKQQLEEKEGRPQICCQRSAQLTLFIKFSYYEPGTTGIPFTGYCKKLNKELKMNGMRRHCCRDRGAMARTIKNFCKALELNAYLPTFATRLK